MASLAELQACGQLRGEADPISNSTRSCPLPGKHPCLTANPLPGARVRQSLYNMAVLEQQLVQQHIAKGAPQTSPMSLWMLFEGSERG